MKQIALAILIMFTFPAFALDVCDKIKTQQLSHTEMAWMYANGICTEQDYERAATLYKQAAALGDVSAQLELALLYELGKGVKQDSAEAYAWHQLALKNARLKYEQWMDSKVADMSSQLKQEGEARLKQIELEINQ